MATILYIGLAILADKLGNFHVDDVTLGPLSSVNTFRGCGVGIKQAEHSVAIENDPLEVRGD
jgi:hypothetical protein